MRLVLLNRTDARRFRAERAVERAVANLQLDDVLSLSLQRLRHGKHRERGFDCERLSKLAKSDRHDWQP